MSMYWPIALIVSSNLIYHICSKQTPAALNPFASLVITYLIGAAVAAALYFTVSHGGNLLKEYSAVSWTSFVMGFAIVGLEAGCMYMYKVGWNINTGYMFQSVIFAIALLFVGYLLYHEELTLTKLLGAAVCLIGLWLIKK
ncbi:MAG: hypothetical protein HUJ80_07410 [Firmicutes bacterium]|nr:hypothetical protein [Bacillota bacterium]